MQASAGVLAMLSSASGVAFAQASRDEAACTALAKLSLPGVALSDVTDAVVSGRIDAAARAICATPDGIAAGLLPS